MKHNQIVFICSHYTTYAEPTDLWCMGCSRFIDNITAVFTLVFTDVQLVNYEVNYIQYTEVRSNKLSNELQ